MVNFRVDVDPPLERTTQALATYSRDLRDLRPFWELLGRSLADDTARLWPLRRRSGKLRRSLTWAGSRLGRLGIYRSRPDRLTYGSRLFYGAFSQVGTKNQPARPLIHIDQSDIGKRLNSWAVERATAAGFEATV